MKRKLTVGVIILFIGGCLLSAKAQQVETIDPPKDKKKIELRPNSRDYGAVKRDNEGTRIDRVKNKNLYVMKRPSVDPKLHKRDINRDLKRDQRIQRKQRQFQRRAINR